MMSADQIASAEVSDLTGAAMSKTAIWAAATLVGVIVVCMTVLAALGKDATQILVVVNIVVVPLLAMFGYTKLKGIEEKTDQVRSQTNGQMSKVFEHLLANQQTQQPPSEPDPAKNDTVPDRRAQF